MFEDLVLNRGIVCAHGVTVHAASQFREIKRWITYKMTTQASAISKQAIPKCACGCGQSVKWSTWEKRFNKFIYGHFNKGELNGQWKGDDIKYDAIHAYVNRHKPKTVDGLCEICHEKPYRDLALNSNKKTYSRNINDYSYLCRLCHMVTDSRIARFYDSKNQTKLSVLANKKKRQNSLKSKSKKIQEVVII
jgi:hypothetical protein